MRIQSPGIEPGDQPIGLTYRGRPLKARTGDTVASALVQAGELACRETASGDRRGVFCGMGVCTECTVQVDGRPGVLACMTPAVEGMQIDLQPAAVPLSAEVEHAGCTEDELAPDLLVIGGGPAGLAAALAAAESGLEVVLVDERSKLGGQYYKQPAAAFSVDESALDAQYRAGRELIARVQQSTVRVLSGTAVWGAFAPDRVHAAGPDAQWVLRPRRLVLATGAYERGVPMPGWTLPGVMSTGAAQSLLRSSQVAPGTRVLVSGNGPLNMQVAAEMVRAGVDVVALAELAPIRSLRAAALSARMAAAAPALALQGAGYLASLARARVPVLIRTAVVRITGEGAVRQAVVARIDRDGRPVPGTERTHDVDAVCVGFGFLPSNEIARSLGCRHRFEPARGTLDVERDETGRSSVPQVWVVGDSATIAGAKVAEAAGALAGRAIAVDLGVAAAGAFGPRRALRRHQRFQDALWRMYAAPLLTDQFAEPDTIVCRCENVTLREARDGISPDLHTAGALKRITRIGMGKCQGRYCGPVVAELTARQAGTTVDDRSGFFSQVPYKPTVIAAMADPEER